jgi:hypothetical protein
MTGLPTSPRTSSEQPPSTGGPYTPRVSPAPRARKRPATRAMGRTGSRSTLVLNRPAARRPPSVLGLHCAPRVPRQPRWPRCCPRPAGSVSNNKDDWRALEHAWLALERAADDVSERRTLRRDPVLRARRPLVVGCLQVDQYSASSVLSTASSSPSGLLKNPRHATSCHVHIAYGQLSRSSAGISPPKLSGA